MGRFMGTEIRRSGESEFQTSKSLGVVIVSEFAALNFFFKKKHEFCLLHIERHHSFWSFTCKSFKGEAL